jgi:hypothetical protein
MTKEIITDEKGELEQQRKAIAKEIEGAEAKLYSTMEQVRRIHYRRLGELFIQLRMTFGKGGGGDREFAKFCDKRFPGLKKAQRIEYMDYRKRLGSMSSKRSLSPDIDLPPLRSVTKPHLYPRDTNRPSDQYRRIVDEEVEDVKAFERKPEINESEAIQEVAQLIITTGFKVLAVKMHPDKDGGSNEAMRRLNKAKKLLQDALIRVAAQLI